MNQFSMAVVMEGAYFCNLFECTLILIINIYLIY